MRHQFDNLQKMKGLIFVLLCALTFVTVVYGENDFNSFYFFEIILELVFRKYVKRDIPVSVFSSLALLLNYSQILLSEPSRHFPAQS